MASLPRRDCPICGGRPSGPTFPYATRFNGKDFSYLQCTSCVTVFVDPVPDDKTFQRMYAKADYHDCHYDCIDQDAYLKSVEFLAAHLPSGKRILDYGCGVGAFLTACASRGYVPFGVDFDPDVARAAGNRARCESSSVEEFERTAEGIVFDSRGGCPRTSAGSVGDDSVARRQTACRRHLVCRGASGG